MANERNLNYVLGYVGKAVECCRRTGRYDSAYPVPGHKQADRMPGEGIGCSSLRKKISASSTERATEVGETRIGESVRVSRLVFRSSGIRAYSCKNGLLAAVAKARSAVPTKESRAASFGAEARALNIEHSNSLSHKIPSL